MEAITEILESLDLDDHRTSEQLIPLVYEELRRLAAARMAAEPPGQTLQATALVHEAWMRIAGDGSGPGWKSRGHFFGAAAEAMRRILVENARRKGCQKRGAGAPRLNIDDLDLMMEGDDERVLAVHEALDRLALVDQEAAALVTLRFFGGLSGAETAAAMGLPVRTATRVWAYARAWLHREMFP